MASILAWAIRAFFSFLTGGIVLKTIGLGLLVGLLSIIWEYALNLVGGAVDLGSANGQLQSLPADVLYFLLLFRIDLALPMILGAFIVRFTIRRLPVIG